MNRLRFIISYVLCIILPILLYKIFGVGGDLGQSFNAILVLLTTLHIISMAVYLLTGHLKKGTEGFSFLGLILLKMFAFGYFYYKYKDLHLIIIPVFLVFFYMLFVETAFLVAWVRRSNKNHTQ